MSKILMLIFFPHLQVHKTTTYKNHPFHQARFQMDWDRKILLNCPLQKGPCHQSHFFIAERDVIL
jgi:hypothetical protein